MNEQGTNRRVFGLDLLRALAIVYVMLSHGYVYSVQLVQIRYYRWLICDGVTLFFVLSGFLIGRILIKTIKDQPGFTFRSLLSFWIRRWFRTLPNYYLVLILLIGSYALVHHQLPPAWGHYFSFTQNFAGPHPVFFAEAWSLAVEEWFYLLIPFGLFILLQLNKKRKETLLFWILCVLVVGTFIRVYKVTLYTYPLENGFDAGIAKQVITRLDGLMYGMFGAWLSIYKPLYWFRHKNKVFIFGLVLLLFANTRSSSFSLGYFYYSLSALGTLCLLPKLSSMETGKGAIYKAITFVSLISYSLYLTNHMVVLRGIMPFLEKILHLNPSMDTGDSVLAFVLFWLLSIGISYGLYRFWELPVMKLRDRMKI